MIGSVVILPSAIALEGAEERSSTVPLTALQDIARSSVVLLERGKRLQEWGSRLQSWPPGARKRAEALLESLSRSGRLVSIEPLKDGPPGCCEDCCALLQIASVTRPTALLVGRKCEAHARSLRQDAESILVDDYAVSDFRDWVQESGARRIAPHTVTAATFEAEVIAPLFRYAKRVTLYDRMVGHQVYERRASIPVLPANFAGTIEWLLDAYHRQGRSTLKLFQLQTGFDMTQVPEGDITHFVDALRRFRDRLSATYPVPFEVYVRAERLRRDTGGLPHARYLVTNQFAVLVDRGFDLLDLRGGQPSDLGHQYLRDVALSRLSDSDRVSLETEVARLPILASAGVT
jgi:hypothetical protein